MLDLRQVKIDENRIFYFRNYHPYRLHDGSVNPKFDMEFSKKILDIKQNEHNWPNYFTPTLNKLLLDNENLVILSVPSHSSGTDAKLNIVIKRLCLERRVIDGSSCLVRHTTVPKNAFGGSREIEKHLRSINLVNTHLLENRDILIIDDVITSGNSLLACKRIVEKHVPNAKSVTCFAFGKTTHND